MSGCVECVMTPAASVTVSDPTPVRPASAELSGAVHWADESVAAPMRVPCSASWRSDASAAVNISRR